MNKSEDERFSELAHKAIAKEAASAELTELDAMLGGDPELKREFEEMKADAGLLREVLPLMEDVQRPEGRIPRMPTERLRREVRAVFEQRQRPQGRLRELLKELEGLVGGGRAAALLQALEGAVLGGLSAEAEPGVLAEERGMAFIAGSAPVRRAASRPRSPERPPEEAERRRREREIAWRLRSMEMRLGEAVDRLGSVSEEARVMLAKIHEERMELERKMAEWPPEG